jgi:type VI secretion system protein ImpM
VSAPGDALPGWYGKIPALGDFASRRLPPDFVQPWDAWLQQAMRAGRAALDEAWQAAYLNCPVWRFGLLPGVCGRTGWAGIMLPSVDKVGRYFPLTVAVALAPQPAMLAAVFAAHDWFGAIEQAALASLRLDATLDEFERALAAAPYRAAPAAAAASEAAACARHALSGAATGKSLWWRGEAGAGAAVLECAGLPPPGRFALLLTGPGPASRPGPG